MDRVKAMRAFVEVARRGSFASAAKQLRISTSSASRLVMELEDWLNTPLLRRTTRRLTLTDAGEQYLERCADIVEATDNLQRDAEALAKQPAGRLNVTVAAFLMHKRIAPLLPAFLEKYPDIRLDLDLRDKPIDLIGEGIDVAIRIGHLADSAMIARRLGGISLRLTASPAFLDEYGAPESLDALPSYPCLVDTVPAHGARWPIGRRIKVEGPVSANDGEIIRRMTLAGLGISFLPELYVEDDIESGRLVSLFADEVDDPVGIYALYPARKQITAAARAFVDFMAIRMANSDQQ
jgi:DNA-binding transcriptional LysR family regulator